MDFLSDDRIGRTVLVELTYHDGTDLRNYYLSNKPYVTSPTETPANTSYDDLLTAVPEIQNSVNAGFSIGSLRFMNTDGNFDEWWQYSFYGHPIKILLGPDGGAKSEFITLVDGINDGLTYPSKELVEIRFRNRALIFDVDSQPQTIGERIGHLYPSEILIEDVADEPCPISLGKVFNVPARRVASSSLLYIVHDDDDCEITEVRDNGVAVTRVDNGDGTFTLSNPPNGNVTADVVTKLGLTTTADVVQNLALRASSSVVFDTDSFSSYPTYSVGIFSPSSTTIISMINDVMLATTGYWYFNRLGEMVIGQIQDPESFDENDIKLFIDVDDIEFGRIRITDYQAPVDRVRIGYQRNYLVQDRDSLAGLVQTEDEDAVARYGREYNEVFTDTGLSPIAWPLLESTELLGKLLSDKSDAQLEADRLANLQSKQRIQIRLNCFTRPFQLNIGDPVVLTHPKWSFSEGRKCVVVSTSEVPTNNRVELELWL